MIDCHTHAFPPLAEAVRGLVPEPVGGLVAAAVERAARALASLSRGLDALTPDALRIDIERAAALRRLLPEGVRELTEVALGLALTPQFLLRGTIPDLVESMDRHGIARSVVIGVPGAAPNAWLLETCRRAGRGAGAGGDDRLVPVAHLPELAADEARAAWDAAFDALVAGGARGFKIHPNTDGLPPDHVAYRALFEAARRHRRFVILHTGSFHVAIYKSFAEAVPRGFEPLFGDYPEVKVCLAHMGRDRPEPVLATMRRFGHVFADVSWQTADAIRAAVAAVGSERLLLGSDWPLLHPDLQGDALDALRRSVSRSDVERIARANAERFLG